MISERVRNALIADEQEAQERRERQARHTALMEKLFHQVPTVLEDGTVITDTVVRDDLPAEMLAVIDEHWQAKRELKTLETAYQHSLSTGWGGNGGVVLTSESATLITRVEDARERVRGLQLEFQSMLAQFGEQS